MNKHYNTTPVILNLNEVKVKNLFDLLTDAMRPKRFFPCPVGSVRMTVGRKPTVLNKP